MLLLKQKPFPHQRGGNVILQQTLPTYRLSPFVLELLPRSTTLGVLTTRHTAPRLPRGTAWQEKCYRTLPTWEAMPMFLPFSLIFCIPEANDFPCLESGNEPQGFCIHSKDSLANPGKGGAINPGKRGCSSILLPEEQQPMTKGTWDR